IRVRPAVDVGALVFAVRAIVNTGMHRAKLVEKKNAAVHPDAFLLVKNRPARIQLDQQSNQQPERRQNSQGKDRDREIERSLNDSRRARERRAKQRDHGQRSDLIDLGLARQAIQQSRRDAKLNATAAPSLNHHVEQGFAGNVRIGDDHFVGPRFANCLRQRFQIADDRHAFERRRGSHNRPVLDNPNHAIAKFGARAHLLNEQRGFRTAAYDQSRNQIDPSAPHRDLAGTKQHARSANARQHQQKIQEENAARIRERSVLHAAAIHERRGHNQQRSNRRRFENAREIIHERKFAAHSIQIVVTIQQYPNGNDERQQHRVRSKLAAPAQRSGGAALYNRVVVTQIKRD